MASISANGSKGHHKFTLNVTETSVDTSNNTSTVSWSLVLSSLGGGYDWYYSTAPVTYSVMVAGNTYSGGIANYDGNSTVTVRSGTLVLPHADDGTKTIGFNFSVSSLDVYYLTGSASASGTMALTKIPRYLSITQFDITNITETTAVCKWAVSDPRTSTYYSLDGGTNWIGSATHGESLASDEKSGQFNIYGLTANTKYNIKIKIKRTDNDLWTESGTKSFTTYNFPYASEKKDFTIGDTLTVKLYNPLSRTCTVTMIGDDNTTIGSWECSGASITGFKAESIVNKLYLSIPNSKNGVYKIKVDYGSSSISKLGGVYSIRGHEVPTIGSFSYYDNSSGVVVITKNNKNIVQDTSLMVVSFGSATPNYGAGSISTYVVECEGTSMTYTTAPQKIYWGTIGSSSDINLKLTVIDSRGMSVTKEIAVKVLEHSNPTAKVTLERLNNYEDTTYLTIDGSVSSVDGKNTMAIKYRYKESGGSYGVYKTVTDKTKQTLTCDKNKIYVFEVVVTDAFGWNFIKEYTLGKGVFPLFIDTEKNSVGVNCFPQEDRSLEVDGFNVLNVQKAWKSILLGDIGGLTIEVKSFGSSDKIPIIVTGAVNSTLTPVFIIIHLRSDGSMSYKSLGGTASVTNSGKKIHISATQRSYFNVIAPLGCEIALSNSTL